MPKFAGSGISLSLFQTTRGQGWMLRAKCRGKTDVGDFFASGANEQRAKNFCTGSGDGVRCPVLDRCRRFSATNKEEYGVWGGLGPDDRRRARVGSSLVRSG
jgi:WhiB family redox-sensing transcriptional regulator